VEQPPVHHHLFCRLLRNIGACLSEGTASSSLDIEFCKRALWLPHCHTASLLKRQHLLFTCVREMSGSSLDGDTDTEIVPGFL
jgi:hypothetical protein